MGLMIVKNKKLSNKIIETLRLRNHPSKMKIEIDEEATRWRIRAGQVAFLKSPNSAEQLIRVNSGFGHFFGEKKVTYKNIY